MSADAGVVRGGRGRRARRARDARGAWVVPALIFVAATLLTAFAVAKLRYLDWRPAGAPLTWWQLLQSRAPLWYTWLLLAPPVVWLGRRYRLDGDRRTRAVLVHLAASFVVALAHMALVVVINGWALLLPFTAESLWERFVNRVEAIVEYEVVAYWAILGLSYAFEYARQVRERELVAARLETQLAGAQLQALRAQLHPHFLFNTLNTIAILMRDGRVSAAVGMVTALGDLLRRSLDAGAGQLVPLSQELEFAEAYLGIERIRFEGRLAVRVDVAPDALHAQVPSFILQPLVENAVRHGLAPSLRGGTLTIRAQRDGDVLRIDVADDGRGFPAGWRQAPRYGIGLANTIERLRRLYGDDQRFGVADAEGGGVVASIVLPFQVAPVAPVASAPSRADPLARASA